jgi:hypothetical protein
MFDEMQIKEITFLNVFSLNFELNTFNFFSLNNFFFYLMLVYIFLTIANKAFMHFDS